MEGLQPTIDIGGNNNGMGNWGGALIGGTAAGRRYERGYALGHGSGYAEEAP